MLITRAWMGNFDGPVLWKMHVRWFFLNLKMIIYVFISLLTVARGVGIISLENHPIQPDDTRTPQYAMTRVKGTIEKHTFYLFKNLTGLEIKWCAISHLDPNAFKPTQLQILEVQNNVEFPNVSRDFFRYLTDLKVFRFDFNPYTTIEDGAFADLKKLDVLSISHQSMKVLTKSFLEGLEGLKELALMDNDIGWIDRDALKGMGELTSIYLGNNQLKILESGTFAWTKSLVDLQLQGNQLGNAENSGKVDWQRFDRILTLRYLNVGDNDLEDLDVQKVVTAFPVLESVNFMPNRLSCANELQVTKMLRHYSIEVEYYGNTRSNCEDLDFGKIGVEVFSEP